MPMRNQNVRSEELMVPARAAYQLSEAAIRAMIASVPFLLHQIEVAPGIVTPGGDRSAEKLAHLNLPSDLSGKRVLDIGAWDGFFSFECERRGAAEVIATDAAPSLSFEIARALLGLERVHAVCKGELIVETLVCGQHVVDASGAAQRLAELAPALLPVPLAQFFPGDEFNDDGSNWWAPNLAGLHAMLRSSGFLPEQTSSAGDRACVHCRRVEQPRLYEWADTLKFDSLPPDHPAARLLEQAGVLEAYAVGEGETPDRQRTYSQPGISALPAPGADDPSRAHVDLQAINQYMLRSYSRACWPRRSRRRAARCCTRSRSWPPAGRGSPTWRRDRAGWRGNRAMRAGRWRRSRTGVCCASCAG
jgi:tRNA (mo5U34)-methyltransferase